LNLCPFAKQFYVQKKVRFSVIDAVEFVDFLKLFGAEVGRLTRQPNIETTLLIVPAFGRVEHFSAFMKYCEEMLVLNEEADNYMIVPFHPYIRHTGQAADAPQQFTGIAPYPIVHILRKKTVDKLGAAYKGDVQADNDKILKKMGFKALQTLWFKMLTE
jgi:uncharacterized protein